MIKLKSQIKAFLKPVMIVLGVILIITALFWWFAGPHTKERLETNLFVAGGLAIIIGVFMRNSSREGTYGSMFSQPYVDSVGKPLTETNLYMYTDSVGKPLTETNLYSYTGNNPVNYVDSMGLYGVPGALGGAAFNFGIQFYANMRLTNNDWHRSFRCIDWGDVGISAIMGALGPTFFGNVVGKNLGPLGLTRSQNILGYFGYALPKGALLKVLTPKLTIGDSCECKGLGLSRAISTVVGP